MNKDKKLLLNDLAKRVEQSRKDRVELHDIPCEELGGSLAVVKMPMGKILDLMDEISEDMPLKEQLNKTRELIYDHVPMLHSKELQSREELAEPYDIVDMVFGDNFFAMQKFANKIFGLYGIEGLENEIKN